MDTDKLYHKYYGENYGKAMENIREGNKSAKISLLRRYPHATLSKFTFTTTLKKDGEIEKSDVWFKNSDTVSTNVDSSTFRNDKSMWIWLHNHKGKQSLTEGGFPMIWLSGGTVQKIQGKRHWEKDIEGKYDFSKFTYLSDNAIDYDLNNFRVYVNDQDSFMAKLPVLNPGNRTDIAKKWNNNEPYYKLIFAVYLSSYCCGVGVEHLKFSDDVYPVVSSIMRFHLYFTTRRILRRLITEKRSDLMREFVVGHDVIDNMANIPREEKFLINPHSGYKHNHPFHEWMWRLNSDYKTHYRRFIPLRTNGFTRVGLQYLNESIEAYVYAVLGSQAKTRVSIVNKGAGSFETQQEFRDLVEDAVVNYSVSTWILNMNRAISDTNVTQNLAISPDTWLVPGSLTILKEKIIGYNNVLRRASEGMKFGINSEVNYQGVHRQPPKTHQESGPHLETLDDSGEQTDKPAVHTPDRPIVHTPDRPIVHTPGKPAVHTPDKPTVHTPDKPTVHTPDRPTVHTPDRPTVHTPDRQPKPDNELGILLVITAVFGYLFSKHIL